MSTLTTEQKQSSQSCLVQLDSKGNIQWVSLNPNPIQVYATDLWESLSEKDTAVTYKQAILKTWRLLKILLILFASVFLLVVAAIISIWGIGFNLGAQFQKWLDNNGQGRQPEEFLKELLNILLLPIQKIVEWANKYVQQYLGWDTSACNFFDSTDENK
jgi:hypothetical protein